MIAEEPQPTVELVVVRQDCAALGGGDVLHRMEAQGRHVRVGPHPARAPLPAQGVAGVFDEHGPVPLGHPPEGGHVEGVTGEAHGRDDLDPAGELPHFGLRANGVHAQRVRVDVRKDRLAPRVERGVRRRDEGQGRGQRALPAPEPRGGHGPVQRRRPVGVGHGVPHSRVIGQNLLEGLHRRPLAQPVALQDPDDLRDVVVVNPLPPVRQVVGVHNLPLSKNQGKR